MQMQMQIRKGTTLVVTLKGELDLVLAEEFRLRVEAELDQTPTLKNLVLVMKEVTFVDSSGLGVILGRYKRIHRMGGRLVAVKLQPQVRRVFEMAGMFKVLEVSESETDALQRV